MAGKMITMLLSAAYLKSSIAFDDFMEEALMMDDECMFGDGEEACAMQALQIKSARAEKTEAQEENFENSGENFGENLEEVAASGESLAVNWVMGQPGQSCAMVCRGAHAMCSDVDLRATKDWQKVWQAASQAGGQCRMSWANDGRHDAGFANAPLICNAAMCGADSQGTCTYDTSGRSSCAGQPAPGFSRLCPCKSAGSYTPSTPSYPTHTQPTYPGGSAYHPGQPQPQPSMPFSPTPSMPYHPGSTPYHPGSTPSSPSTTKTCKTLETGGTCSVFGCAKSRGVGVKCEKKKCVCLPGYCAMKGVCRKM